MVLLPKGQKTTIERIAFYYADAQMLSADYAVMRAKNAAMCEDVIMEDIEVLGGMQAGLMAPSYDGGKLSAVMDYPTHHFHKWVVQRMMRADQDDLLI